MLNKGLKDNKEVKRGFALKCIMNGPQISWAVQTQNINPIELIGTLTLILNKETEKMNMTKNDGVVA